MTFLRRTLFSATLLAVVWADVGGSALAAQDGQPPAPPTAGPLTTTTEAVDPVMLRRRINFWYSDREIATLFSGPMVREYD